MPLRPLKQPASGSSQTRQRRPRSRKRQPRRAVEAARCGLDALPDAVLVTGLCSFLDGRELAVLSHCSRRLRTACTHALAAQFDSLLGVPGAAQAEDRATVAAVVHASGRPTPASDKALLAWACAANAAAPVARVALRRGATFLDLRACPSTDSGALAAMPDNPPPDPRWTCVAAATTPLVRAALHGSAAVVDALLELGADATARPCLVGPASARAAAAPPAAADPAAASQEPADPRSDGGTRAGAGSAAAGSAALPAPGNPSAPIASAPATTTTTAPATTTATAVSIAAPNPPPGAAAAPGPAAPQPALAAAQPAARPQRASPASLAALRASFVDRQPPRRPPSALRRPAVREPHPSDPASLRAAAARPASASSSAAGPGRTSLRRRAGAPALPLPSIVCAALHVTELSALHVLAASGRTSALVSVLRREASREHPDTGRSGRPESGHLRGGSSAGDSIGTDALARAELARVAASPWAVSVADTPVGGWRCRTALEEALCEDWAAAAGAAAGERQHQPGRAAGRPPMPGPLGALAAGVGVLASADPLSARPRGAAAAAGAAGSAGSSSSSSAGSAAAASEVPDEGAVVGGISAATLAAAHGSAARLPGPAGRTATSAVEQEEQAQRVLARCVAAGATPLLLAAAGGHARTCNALMRWGALPDAVSPERDVSGGWTPLHAAAAAGKRGFAAVVALLAAGAHPSPVTHGLKTPLILAAERGAGRSVAALVRAGAALDLRSDSGKTALLSAVEGGHADIAATLLQAGASPHIPSLRRKSPLHAAVDVGDACLVELIVRADPAGAAAAATATTKVGTSALQQAQRSRNQDLIEVLELAINQPDSFQRLAVSRWTGGAAAPAVPATALGSVADAAGRTDADTRASEGTGPAGSGAGAAGAAAAALAPAVAAAGAALSGTLRGSRASSFRGSAGVTGRVAVPVGASAALPLNGGPLGVAKLALATASIGAGMAAPSGASGPGGEAGAAAPSTTIVWDGGMALRLAAEPILPDGATHAGRDRRSQSRPKPRQSRPQTAGRPQARAARGTEGRRSVTPAVRAAGASGQRLAAAPPAPASGFPAAEVAAAAAAALAASSSELQRAHGASDGATAGPSGGPGARSAGAGRVAAQRRPSLGPPGPPVKSLRLTGSFCCARGRSQPQTTRLQSRAGQRVTAVGQLGARAEPALPSESALRTSVTALPIGASLTSSSSSSSLGSATSARASVECPSRPPSCQLSAAAPQPETCSGGDSGEVPPSQRSTVRSASRVGCAAGDKPRSPSMRRARSFGAVGAAQSPRQHRTAAAGPAAKRRVAERTDVDTASRASSASSGAGSRQPGAPLSSNCAGRGAALPLAGQMDHGRGKAAALPTERAADRKPSGRAAGAGRPTAPAAAAAPEAAGAATVRSSRASSRARRSRGQPAASQGLGPTFADRLRVGTALTGPARAYGSAQPSPTIASSVGGQRASLWAAAGVASSQPDAGRRSGRGSSSSIASLRRALAADDSGRGDGGASSRSQRAARQGAASGRATSQLQRLAGSGGDMSGSWSARTGPSAALALPVVGVRTGGSAPRRLHATSGAAASVAPSFAASKAATAVLVQSGASALPAVVRSVSVGVWPRM